RERSRQPLEADAGEKTAERPGKPPERQSEPEAARIGQHLGQEEAQALLLWRAMALCLDARPGKIDEMHVIDAARAGGHAGEAGEAAIDVVGHRRRYLALLEHLLHQVDAAARAVALIPREHIGRAGRGAEAAMHAALQDRIRAGDGRIGELDLVETGLHRFSLYPRIHAAGIENTDRIQR